MLRWPILWWLRFWAKLALKIVNPTVIGITGSAGKTSARDVIGKIARLKFNKVKVSDKANSESGIPADILGLHFTNYSPFDWLRICLLAPIRVIIYYFLFSTHFDCYVVEMGVDEPMAPKNMGYLLSILRPQVGVLLNVLPVHTAQFGKQLGIKNRDELIKAIAHEKGKLLLNNPGFKTGVINWGLLESGLIRKPTGEKWITFGKSKKANINIVNFNSSPMGTILILQFNKINYEIKLANFVLPDYYGETLAASFATGVALSIEPEKIIETLSRKFILPPGRGQLLKGINNSIIVDSSYNASREPMIGSLELLKKIAGDKVKIAILGDMRELGKQARVEHEAVAKKIIETANKAILVGPLMKKYVLPILEQSGFQVKWFTTAGEAAVYIKNNLSKNSVVLIKGSQNTIFLEIVVETLLADKNDIQKLCRRGKFWDRQRRPYSADELIVY